MAIVSQPPQRQGSSYKVYRRSRRPTRWLLAGLLILVLLLVAAGGVLIATRGPSLGSDPDALAKVNMPLGAGHIVSVTAVTGRTGRLVPVAVRDNRIWPLGRLRAGSQVTIDVVVKRPGWISWLSGSTDRLHLTFVTPTVAPRQTYLTLSRGAPLRVSLDHPAVVVAYGPTAGQLGRHVLGTPSNELTIPHRGEAGTVWVAALARTWETTSASPVSWFPSGAATAAVASPAPGTTIGPSSPIALTFSKPVATALGNQRPPVSPTTSGSWQQTSPHTIVFRPSGYGYGLGAHVRVALPAGVRLVGGQGGGASEEGSWQVPAGSTVRLQQLLATLGYLPLSYQSSSSVASTPGAQEEAAIHPPQGSFSWRYGKVPDSLHSMWAPGVAGEMTKGAVMAFENDHGMTADGVAGPGVWKALLGAAISGRRSAFGYTYVQVSEASPESINVWHNGKTVVTGPVNTGIPQAPTAQGTFAVFEHAPSVTMSGTNPDGSHYSDPGVPYVSYFNGGDALHGFLRASYGSAQSLGCVEMPYSEAAAVYPYTPIGTLVHVA